MLTSNDSEQKMYLRLGFKVSHRIGLTSQTAARLSETDRSVRAFRTYMRFKRNSGIECREKIAADGCQQVDLNIRVGHLRLTLREMLFCNRTLRELSGAIGGDSQGSLKKKQRSIDGRTSSARSRESGTQVNMKQFPT